MNDIGRNLRMLRKRAGIASITEVASRAGLDRSSLNRVFSGARLPTENQLRALALLFNVSEQTIRLPESEFQKVIIVDDDIFPVLSFSAVDLHRSKWEEVFKRVQGQFKTYYGKTQDGRRLVSLLHFEALTDRGISISFFNPYEDTDGSMMMYRYRGTAFPVNELIYGFAEQVSGNDYEVISLIMSIARTPLVNSIQGIISGVGVVKNRSMIAAQAFLATRCAIIRDTSNRRLFKEIGYKNIGTLTPAAQSFYDESIRLR